MLADLHGFHSPGTCTRSAKRMQSSRFVRLDGLDAAGCRKLFMYVSMHEVSRVVDPQRCGSDQLCNLMPKHLCRVMMLFRGLGIAEWTQLRGNYPRRSRECTQHLVCHFVAEMERIVGLLVHVGGLIVYSSLYSFFSIYPASILHLCKKDDYDAVRAQTGGTRQSCMRTRIRAISRRFGSISAFRSAANASSSLGCTYDSRPILF
jgi:hypothetical protein